MGAPGSVVKATEQSAEALLDVFKTITPAEKSRHAMVLEYWLSIRGSRELPPLRDLDPLEISGAAPGSLLLELLGGGEDADIRHVGDELRGSADFDKIGQAPRPSIFASISRKLSIVAISRNFLCFEDEFVVDGESTRCWVTMLPFSSAGAWVDYVYAYVSVAAGEDGAEAAEAIQPVPEVEVREAIDAVADVEPVEAASEAEHADEVESIEAVEELEPAEVLEPEPEEDELSDVDDVLELDSPVEEAGEDEAADIGAIDAPEATHEAAEGETLEPADPEPTETPAPKTPGFTFDASSTGFYGTNVVKVKPTLPPVPAANAEPVPEATQVEEEEIPAPSATQESPPVEREDLKPAAEDKPRKVISAQEGSLQSKLTDVRAKADEARMAKLRANVALYEGLSAAYDFALDAEDSPEEYLKLVEAQGLKIQLRAPMRPVVKLAFNGMCDDSTITQLEAVLAWAIEQDLPRGSLAEKIEEAGGIGPILTGQAEAA